MEITKLMTPCEIYFELANVNIYQLFEMNYLLSFFLRWSLIQSNAYLSG